MPFSIVNIRKLNLFKPQLLKGSLYECVEHDAFTVDEYFHFPTLLSPDLSIWAHGSLYLLSKLENFKQPNHSTLSSQASDLIAFMNYMDTKEIDYLSIPKRKAARPTYQFRFHLQDLIKNRKISDKTASRRMNAVINFYRWLSKQSDVEFQHEPWIESTYSISYDTDVGLRRTKLVSTTDLAVRVSPNNDTYNNYLSDGGKLRPLSEAEQTVILKSLGELGNTEMTLMFLLALSTGARLQTICTLRLSDLKTSYTDNEVRVVCGPGTLIDTKLGKRSILYIPVWLFKKLTTYSLSPRALKRRQRASTYKGSLEQYIFLTKGGVPFYMGKDDPSIGIVKRMPTGNAITQFIRNTLLPKLNTSGHHFVFRFHDLRASYGMNLVDINQKKLVDGEITYQKLKDFIRERMWHQSVNTTDAYLQYRSNHDFLVNIQNDYEQHLLSLMEKAFNY